MKYTTLLILLFFIGSNCVDTHGDTSFDPIEIWKSSHAMLNHYRITFEYESHPTPYFEEMLKQKAPSPEVYSTVVAIFSKESGKIHIVRKGNQAKYETSKFHENIDATSLSNNELNFMASHKVADYIQSHGSQLFKYYDVRTSTGTVRPDWHDQPQTIIDEIKPSSNGNYKLIEKTQNVLVYEQIDKSGTLARRYYLDPNVGMMPIKIENYSINDDGLRRCRKEIIVEKYGQHNGIYVPIKSKTYDWRWGSGSTRNWRMEKVVEALSVDVETEIADSEFNFTFPTGTLVHDLITGISYRTTEGGNADYVDPDESARNNDLPEELNQPLKNDSKQKELLLSNEDLPRSMPGNAVSKKSPKKDSVEKSSGDLKFFWPFSHLALIGIIFIVLIAIIVIFWARKQRANPHV